MTKTVPITYIEPNGEEKEVQAEVGKNLLDIAHDNNIELEGTKPLGDCRAVAFQLDNERCRMSGSKAEDTVSCIFML